MKKKPKNAPWPVLMILLPFVAVMTLWDLAGWLVSIVWDGLQRLGPRFQGIVIGVWATMMFFCLAASLAVLG
ncbi:hypothetical protein [Acidaminococcus fermentans]|uniref:hypothetical protein n=1 Tax=Acidaminococcus fermentans TaxID=905 RepID=UPI000D1023DA|nr:hypothetical protein [Acidaminococcus fermentans]MDY4146801.1 hypothetical protein [Acidaminococcus fermentans]